MRFSIKLAISLCFSLLSSCQGQKDSIEVIKADSKKRDSYYHPFNGLKQSKDCLKDRFQKYPEGNQIGGIKTCLKKDGDNHVYFIQFEKDGKDPICFLPMTYYKDRTKEYIGDPVCIEQKKGQTFKVRLRKNREGVNQKGDKFSEQKLNALFVVKDYRDALNQFHCCSNSDYYNEPGTGYPFPRCTYEYKINICSEFLLNYKGNYIHRLNYLIK